MGRPSQDASYWWLSLFIGLSVSFSRLHFCLSPWVRREPFAKAHDLRRGEAPGLVVGLSCPALGIQCAPFYEHIELATLLARCLCRAWSHVRKAVGREEGEVFAAGSARWRNDGLPDVRNLPLALSNDHDPVSDFHVLAEGIAKAYNYHCGRLYCSTGNVAELRSSHQLCPGLCHVCFDRIAISTEFVFRLSPNEGSVVTDRENAER